MTTYRRMIEANDNEGETWNWWLATAGNETALDRIKDFLIEDDWDPSELGVTDDELSGPEVDLLVRFADAGYYMSHNKVNGLLELPETLDDDFVDAHALYKGGIRAFFKTDEDEAA